MATRGTFHFFLMSALLLCLCGAVTAKEKSADVTGADPDTSSVDSRVEKTDPAEEGGTAGRENGEVNGEKSKAEAARKEKTKKEEHKKKEARKNTEAGKKEHASKDGKRTHEAKEEEPDAVDTDPESRDSLLFIDHEKIKYNRIPGITIKADAEAPEESIVRIPESKISGKSKTKKSEDDGLFARKRGAIAGWGIVIFIFIVFVIYSKMRGRKSRRRVVRTVPKR